MSKNEDPRIKFNLLNFNQEMLCELNKIGLLLYEKEKNKEIKYILDFFDLFIIQWYIDFFHSKRMTKITHEGFEYNWIKYEALIEEFPFVTRGITTKSMRLRFKKMQKLKIFYHYHYTNGGSWSYYRINKDIYDLLYYENNQDNTIRENNKNKLWEIFDIPYNANVRPPTTQTFEQKPFYK